MRFFKKRNSNIPRRQHYVPKTYLSHFADDDDCIHVYNKNEHKMFSTGYGHIGFENYFYANGEEAIVIEEIFKKNFEDDYNKYVHELNKGNLNAKCNEFFANFVSVQFLRVPFYREMMSQITLAIGEKIDDDSVQFTKEKHVHIILKKYKFYSEFLLENFHWIVCTSNQETFMTSDNPCVIINDVDRQVMGFGRPGCQIYFPVSKNICLVLIQKNTTLQDLQNSSSISRNTRRYYKKMFLKNGNMKIEDIMPNKLSFSKEQVVYANELQAQLSLSYIFNTNIDFSIINKIREDDLAYGRKDRKLISIN